MFSEKCGISGEVELLWTLGIGVNRDYRTRAISVSPETYTYNSVERNGLQSANTVTTPLVSGANLTKDQCPKTTEELQDMPGNSYRELVGSLQYIPRPDISFALRRLTQFLEDPGHARLEAPRRALRYIKGTKNRSLNLGGDVADLAECMDSDWGGDRDDQKSISAYIFRMGDGAISSKTKNQTSVTL